MANEERLTNKERRAEARGERKRAEAEAAKKASRRRMINTIVTVIVLIAVVGGIVWLVALRESPVPDGGIVVLESEVTAARDAAGCLDLAVSPSIGGEHIEPQEAPPASVLYAQLRPGAGGPHFPQWGSLGSFSNPIEERAATHNLEHGSVAIYYDPSKVEDGDAAKVKDFVDTLNGAGFLSAAQGAGLIAAPFEEDFTSGKAIAFRAWGAATDCDTFDETVGNAFLLTSFGTRGFAPEGNFGGFPSDVMRFGTVVDSPSTTPSPTPSPTSSTTPDASPSPAAGSPSPSPAETATSSPSPSPTPSDG